MPEAGPGIGLVVQDEKRGQALRSAMMRSGTAMAFFGTPDELEPHWARAPRSEVMAWVVDLSGDAEWPIALEDLIADTEVPVLFSDAESGLTDAESLRGWADQLLVKLGEMIPGAHGDVSADADGGVAQPHRAMPAREVSSGLNVWVLAASLGGPEAVKQFLDTLPPEVPVAFVYAQHTDENFQSTLSRLLGRHSGYELVLAKNELRLRPGLVVMLPVENAYGFDADGFTHRLEQAWRGPYTPCVDEVITGVAEAFAPNAGVIVFSGMGEDGSVGAREMASRGGEVWIQDPASCACSSMPEEAARAVPGGYRGNPEQLARHLAASMKRQVPTTCRPVAGSW